MSREDVRARFIDESSSGHVSDDDEVELRKDKRSVKQMIQRFERSGINLGSSESLERSKDPILGSLTSIVNPLQNHFQYLTPVPKTQDRNSNVSVNSILSNVSEISYESSSSGFLSDRKSSSIKPHRPAPPPPKPFDDASSVDSKTSAIEENTAVERRFSFTTPSSSPVVLRRSRQPPVIRRKSSIGSQGRMTETHWSYGVKQSDLEKLLRLKLSETSDNELEIKDNKSRAILSSSNESSSDDSNDSDKLKEGDEYVVNNDDGRADTISTDHSTDTLMNEYESDDNLSSASEEQCNFDNVSIKSISSLDMVPYQKYDSITVSSDEFGSEVCHAPDTEFLTVSAVNEWCVTKSIEPVLLPVESKKEKYRR